MKRQSRKNRKLQYIRQKNYYRFGGEGRDFIMASNELINDVSYLEPVIKIKLDKIGNKFKMEFNLISMEFSSENGDNFIKDCTTVKFKYKSINYLKT